MITECNFTLEYSLDIKAYAEAQHRKGIIFECWVQNINLVTCVVQGCTGQYPQIPMWLF